MYERLRRSKQTTPTDGGTGLSISDVKGSEPEWASRGVDADGDHGRGYRLSPSNIGGMNVMRGRDGRPGGRTQRPHALQQRLHESTAKSVQRCPPKAGNDPALNGGKR